MTLLFLTLLLLILLGVRLLAPPGSSQPSSLSPPGGPADLRGGPGFAPESPRVGPRTTPVLRGVTSPGLVLVPAGGGAAASSLLCFDDPRGLGGPPDFRTIFLRPPWLACPSHGAGELLETGSTL